MYSNPRVNFSIKQDIVPFTHAASLKSIRSSLAQVPSKEKNLVKGKTKSPTGWLNWTGDSSPSSKYKMNLLKLPPIPSEIRRSSLLENKFDPVVPTLQHKFNDRIRGSIVNQPNYSLNPRGSILIPTQNNEKTDSESEDDNDQGDERKAEYNEKNNIPRQSLVYQDSIQASNYVTRCACKTLTGSVMGKKKKHNQDSWIIEQKLQGVKGQFLFAVCDGHGEKGHKVSNLIKKSLLAHVGSALSATINPDLQLDKIVSAGIKSMVSSIESSDLELKYSGSTMVSAFIRGKSLVCANIGDSRAVIGQRVKGTWKAVEISSDHKPSREDEAIRIIKAGGVVRQYKMNSGEGVGPLRIWSNNKDSIGLAMSRSIGDSNAKSYGLISDAEITVWTIGKNDKFMVLATDGIWEFIGSQEAVDIVKDVWKMGKSEACCDKLIEVAQKRWETENVVDDITVIVVFFRG